MGKFYLIFMVLLVASREGCKKKDLCKPCNDTYVINRVFIEKNDKPYTGNVKETDSVYLVVLIDKPDITCCKKSLSLIILFDKDSTTTVRCSRLLDEYNTCGNQICVKQFINDRTLSKKEGIIKASCILQGDEDGGDKNTILFHYIPRKDECLVRDITVRKAFEEKYDNRAAINSVHIFSNEKSSFEVGGKYFVAVDWNYFLATGQSGVAELIIRPSSLTRQFIQMRDTVRTHLLKFNAEVPYERFDFTITKRPDYEMKFCVSVRIKESVVPSDEMCETKSFQDHVHKILAK